MNETIKYFPMKRHPLTILYLLDMVSMIISVSRKLLRILSRSITAQTPSQGPEDILTLPQKIFHHTGLISLITLKKAWKLTLNILIGTVLSWNWILRLFKINLKCYILLLYREHADFDNRNSRSSLDMLHHHKLVTRRSHFKLGYGDMQKLDEMSSGFERMTVPSKETSH